MMSEMDVYKRKWSGSSQRHMVGKVEGGGKGVIRMG